MRCVGSHWLLPAAGDLFAGDGGEQQRGGISAMRALAPCAGPVLPAMSVHFGSFGASRAVHVKGGEWSPRRPAAYSTWGRPSTHDAFVGHAFRHGRVSSLALLLFCEGWICQTVINPAPLQDASRAVMG
ncbi:hypothetical protein NDU88_001824 [Pleurodeles waltl]|uniref:Uncharacterized protein n=1 Tax=Pleurodeles waltl TaxID=8319 RepID=A0AAV7S9V1_PLEWA|nr:hypothetical protein NDU88_001824 [Pleurodeles waltl]